MNKLPVLGKGFLHRYNVDCLCIAQGIKGILRLKPKLDFDVFLPSKGMNLQRDLVWSQEQKEAFIESIIVRRNIPPISVILDNNEIYQVIDGKQRLTTLLAYLEGKFSLCGYTINTLPKKYYDQIDRFFLEANRICEPWDGKTTISDDEKIEWFCYINFAGVPQEIEHKNKLLASIK